MGLVVRTDDIISSTEVVKNFANCRTKVKNNERLIIFKNNKPDLVLLDIEAYEKILDMVNQLEDISIGELVEKRKMTDNGNRYSLDDLDKMIQEENSNNNIQLASV